MASGGKAGRRGAGARGELVLVAGAAPKKRRAVARDWSKAKEQKFVETLTATCNVTIACEAAGVSTTSAYQRRSGRCWGRSSWWGEEDLGCLRDRGRGSVARAALRAG